MGRNRYNTYRGRKSAGRTVLLVVVVVLVVVLILAAVGVFFLRDYFVYTDNGPRLELPFLGGNKPGSSVSANRPDPTRPPEDGFIVEPVEPTGSARPEETPAPSEEPPAEPAPEIPADFSYTPLPRRTAPLGLLAAKGEPDPDRGYLFNMTAPETAGAESWAALWERNQALRYAGAYVACGTDTPAERFTALAYSGFDEIVVEVTEAETAADADVAGLYRDVRAALDDIGYQGYLSVVCRRSVFTDGGKVATVLPAVAESCDRVYASHEDSWGGLNIYNQLKELDFRGATRDIVTVVNKQVSVNWAWAILPQ